MQTKLEGAAAADPNVGQSLGEALTLTPSARLVESLRLDMR